MWRCARHFAALGPRHGIRLAASGRGGPASGTAADTASSSGSAGTAAAAEASPFQGRLSSEGMVLPIADADSDALYSDSSSIEERLQRRLRRKTTSAGLGAQEDAAGMFLEDRKDRPEAGKWEAFQVADNKEHLEAFQNVVRRLRVRREAGQRDPSQSMDKVMDYLLKKKKKEGK
mmetsp:Transcript_60039/g.113150  ORF Transcript_60039/g.113150 Transcript_60039/m.113150 type:complete len:175 (-) Transcript_60039:54-578(-)